MNSFASTDPTDAGQSIAIHMLAVELVRRGPEAAHAFATGMIAGVLIWAAVNAAQCPAPSTETTH